MMQRVTGKYIYLGAGGDVAYWKERLEPGRKSAKEFRFYHGDRQSGRGGDSILYNLPNVIKSKAVIFTEGEKQADIVNAWGLCGTTFDSGSNSKFPAAMVDHFRGKRVAVLRDNDDPGLVYAKMIGRTLHGVAEMVKIVLLPGLPHKGDICDWNGDRAALIDAIQREDPFEFVPVAVKKPQRQQQENPDVGGDQVTAAKSVPVDTLLTFQGGYAYCLWHTEDNPSLHHHQKSNKVKCFSCGKSGDAIDIVMQRDGISFIESVKLLCGQP